MYSSLRVVKEARRQAEKLYSWLQVVEDDPVYELSADYLVNLRALLDELQQILESDQ